MSTMDEKQIKKDIKPLKKEAKKKKNPWAVLAGIYLLRLVRNDRELDSFKREASKLDITPKVDEAVVAFLREGKRELLCGLPEGMGEFFSKAFEAHVDDSFKECFSRLPSVAFKAEVAKLFVGALLERGEGDLALYFLNQVEKVKDPRIWFLAGWAYELKGIINVAKGFLEKAAKEGVEEAKLRLAEIFVKQGDFAKAASVFEEMGRLNEAVRFFVEAGKLDKAFELVSSMDDPRLKVEIASALLEAGKRDKALEAVEGVELDEAKAIKARLIFEEDPQLAFELARGAIKSLKGKYRLWAVEVIAEYYEKEGMFKELTTFLAPLETAGSLSQPLRLKLASAYREIGDLPRALKILATLMDTELRRQAKSLVKEIKKEAEDPELVEICEAILAEDTFFKRLKEGLKKSKDSILGRLEELIEDKKQVRDVSIDELEEILLSADMGVEATQEIVGNLKRRMEIGEIKSGQGLMRALEEEVLRILKGAEGRLCLDAKPTVIMVVGVNGTGKTTTIAKLGHMLKSRGYSVLFAAGDTFRAAAIEQLEVWGERVQVPVVKHKPGADPSGVVYDAVNAAKARGVDVVIIDTAGRLHTKVNLMEELKKMARVASREVPGAPHETLLVLDAVVGQNAVSQCKLFSEAVPVTGIVLTKLDGTAKGGIVVAIAKKFGIPIKFIGVGERMDDLQEFDAERFVDALFDR